MTRRSSVNPWLIVKQFSRIAPHPWIGWQLVKLEAEKRLFGWFHRQADQGQAGKIRQVSIRITDFCNLRCHTCGQWGDSGFMHDQDPRELKKHEVSPARYLEVFADLVTAGHRPLIYFWGGEPMLYHGLLDLIEGASAMGLPPSIATNGTRLAASAERLVKAPLFLLQVSIDGHNAETHNSARPAAGGGNNYRDILEGLAEIRAQRKARHTTLPVIASLTTVSRSNFRHLVDIYDAFKDLVDMFVFYPSWWIDQERAAEHEQDFNRRFGFEPVRHRGWIGDWRPDDLQALHQQFQGLRDRSRSLTAPPVTLIPNLTTVDEVRSYYTDHRARFGFDQCISIFQAVEINSNGDMSPCRDYHDYVVGNIKDETITELWNSPQYIRFRKSLVRDGLLPVCTRCCGLMGY